ncbi:hypothetical protein TNCT_342461 [Trichonephila clavata]|uniref:Uncharacterized protein n=1 Tax=Trichonephila clavata TaxID=2740835 RepID=A0A8X6JQQ1_TRICU|nr:hypothetical protein TNCT_342461 [Trichonephila clavata]
MEFLGDSELSSSLPSIEQFPANKKIVQQWQQQESRHFKRPTLDDAMGCIHFYQKEGKIICYNCKMMRIISSLMYD